MTANPTTSWSNKDLRLGACRASPYPIRIGAYTSQAWARLENFKKARLEFVCKSYLLHAVFAANSHEGHQANLSHGDWETSWRPDLEISRLS